VAGLSWIFIHDKVDGDLMALFLGLGFSIAFPSTGKFSVDALDNNKTLNIVLYELKEIIVIT